MGLADKLKLVTLGQNQGGRATRLITEGMRDGDWIFVTNCHLSPQWMSQLSSLYDRMSTASSSFRLWLATQPMDSFPLHILRDSVKMAIESPSGVKSTLTKFLNLANQWPDDFLLQRAIFASACFHCQWSLFMKYFV